MKQKTDIEIPYAGKLALELIEKIEEVECLRKRVAFLEAELAKDSKPVFDAQGKAINLIRV